MGSFITFSIFKSIFPEKMTVVSQVLVRMWGNWNSQGMKCKMAQLHWKTAQQFLKKFIICLPYDPSTPLLGVYPREMKSAVHTESWTRMFSAALFTPPKKKWNRTKCLSKWMDTYTGTSVQWTSPEWQKGISHRDPLHYGWISNNSAEWKKTKKSIW